MDSQLQPNNKQHRLICPKNTKVPRLIKGMAALMKGKTTEEARRFMKVMGIAIYESSLKARSAARQERQQKSIAAVDLD